MLPPFEIHQPATVADAASLRDRHGESAAVYAGGSELVLAMKEGLGAFEHLIDVKTVPDLHRLEVAPDGTLVIGTAVTHRTLERSPLVRERFALLGEMERQIANPRVRAVGTLGGNLCFGEPHSDPATLLLVHGAVLTLEGRDGRRRLPLAEFMTGPYETALGPDEILTTIEVAPPPPGAAGAYLKFGMHERPTLGVAVLLVPDEARLRVAEARIAVGCVGPVATRLPAVERAAAGVTLASLTSGFAAADDAGRTIDAVSDLHGSAEYKRHLVSVFVKRALAAAASRMQAAA